jgi:cytoskeleton protein RodZ
MTSVGETLRCERLRRNLQLDQISRELRISARFLEAIESEQFDQLPAPVFVRSFVRQYARLLGLNDQELTAQLQRTIEPAEAAAPAQEEPRQVMQEIHVPKMEWETVGERRFQWKAPLSSLAGVVSVMLVCSVVYAWWQRQHTAAAPGASAVTQAVHAPAPPTPEPPSAQATEAAANPEPLPASPVAGAPPSAADPGLPPAVGESAQAKPAESAPAQAPPQPQADAPITVRLELTADEPVWVLARADGKYLFSGTLDAHQTRTVEAAGTIVLRLGNAGGVNVTLNGKNLGTLGPKGQVRTIQFTSGGFQIVPAPKPPAPADLR